MAEDYAREITKRSVARACLAFGINHTSSDVLDCLTDLTKHYIEAIAKKSNEISEVGGRSNPGIQDIIEAIKLTTKGKDEWKELKEFASPSNNEVGWNQPFPYQIFSFPERSSRDILSDDTEGLRRPYIPSHLPSFPPIHTYKQNNTIPGIIGSKRKSQDVENVSKRIEKMKSSHINETDNS